MHSFTAQCTLTRVASVPRARDGSSPAVARALANACVAQKFSARSAFLGKPSLQAAIPSVRMQRGGRADSMVTRASASEEVPDRLQELGAEVSELLNGSSIFLVGMMGSGKSSMGKLLGDSMKHAHFDSDAVIEQLTKTKVADLFAEDGEEAFREIETQVIQELCSYIKVVVSTGGGAVVTRSNWMHMQQAVVLYLDYPVEVLAARVVADGSAATRPKLASFNDDESAIAEYLKEIYAERETLYRQADIWVSFDDEEGAKADVEAVTLRVLLKLKERLTDDAQQDKLKTPPKKGDVKIEQAPRGFGKA